MSAKRSRAFHARLEGLERRETPSSHASAVTPALKAVNIQSGGVAHVNYSQPIQEGQLVRTAASGTAKGTLGLYSAELDVFYATGARVGVGTGVITALNGDAIDLRLHSTAQNPQSPSGGTGAIRFTVTGGTGAFARATGRGAFTGHVNTLYDFGYTLSGRVKA